MFWRCRRLWPGDPLFCPERFGELKVSYVYEAIRQGQRLRRQELHEGELAVANLTALTANLNRDSKKQKTPYAVKDFCFFADEQDHGPDEEPASAYHRLLADGLLPAWALFVFKQFKGKGSVSASPEPVAAIADDFILLAPREVSGGLEGLLLARSSVAGQTISASIGHTHCRVTVPEFEDSVLARENVYIPTS